MNIPARRADAEHDIREALGALEIAKAKLRAVQLACLHPNEKKWTSTDYGGFTDVNTDCPDCGRKTSR
jgi:hypothetical protein